MGLVPTEGEGGIHQCVDGGSGGDFDLHPVFFGLVRRLGADAQGVDTVQMFRAGHFCKAAHGRRAGKDRPGPPVQQGERVEDGGDGDRLINRSVNHLHAGDGRQPFHQRRAALPGTSEENPVPCLKLSGQREAEAVRVVGRGYQIGQQAEPGQPVRCSLSESRNFEMGQPPDVQGPRPKQVEEQLHAAGTGED